MVDWTNADLLRDVRESLSAVAAAAAFPATPFDDILEEEAKPSAAAKAQQHKIPRPLPAPPTPNSRRKPQQKQQRLQPQPPPLLRTATTASAAAAVPPPQLRRQLAASLPEREAAFACAVCGFSFATEQALADHTATAHPQKQPQQPQQPQKEDDFFAEIAGHLENARQRAQQGSSSSGGASALPQQRVDLLSSQPPLSAIAPSTSPSPREPQPLQPLQPQHQGRRSRLFFGSSRRSPSPSPPPQQPQQQKITPRGTTLLVDTTPDVVVPVAEPLPIKLLRPRKRRTEIECVVFAQACARRWLVNRWSRPELHRCHLAHELARSEDTYTSSLKNVIATFVGPLRKAAESKQPIISLSDIGFLFARFEPILRLNLELLEQLQRRVKRWHFGSCIADVFLKLDYELMFELYSEYTLAYSDICNKLLELRKRVSKFDEFVEEKEKLFWGNSKTGNSLQSFLILPIQRLPRYVLILKEMQKWTLEAHRDFDNVDKALEKLENLCWRINETRRAKDLEHQRVSALFEVAQRLDPTPKQLTDSADRVFLAEAAVKQADFIRELLMERYVFVFTDILIVGKQKTRGSSRRVRMKNVVPLLGAHIKDFEGPQILYGKEVEHSLELHSREGTFFLVFASQSSKAELLRHIQAAISQVRSRTVKKQ